MRVCLSRRIVSFTRYYLKKNIRNISYFNSDHDFIQIESLEKIKNGGKLRFGFSSYGMENLDSIVYAEYFKEVGEKIEIDDEVGTVESVKASIDIIPNIAGKISYLNTEFIEAIQNSQTGLNEINNLKDYDEENGLALMELEIDKQEATRIEKLIEEGEWSEEENI
jgi:glycine cleavage system H lipoate-binding protein